MDHFLHCRYIEEFMKKRQEWQVAEKAALEEENRKILEFAKMQQRREEDRMADARSREAIKQKLVEELSSKLAQDVADRDELERIRTELLMEEQEENERMKERNVIEKRLRDMVSLQKSYAQQQQLKELQKEAELAEEEEFRRKMLEKFANDDKIEQMNAQKRRMKQLEHKRAIEELIENRRKMQIAERQADLDQAKQAEQLEKFRRQIIEEERRKLIQEHAEKLLGYLPKGVFKDSSDLDLLPEDLKKKYSERQVDPFSSEDFFM